jgi:D-alanyl-D-alanine carboxypeptidase
MQGRYRTGSRIAAFAFAAVLVGVFVPSAHAGKAPEPDAADAALDKAITEFAARRGGPPGVISVVQRGDEVKVHTAGVADVQTGAPPAVDDHMRIASVAKAFSGAAAVAVVADGALSLDDTIGQRLPSLPRAWKDVTLAQALQHRSGIPDFTKSKALARAVTASPLAPPPPAELLSFVRDKPLEFKPGSKYDYSNSDNIVVGLMIEAATGRPYEEVLQEKVYGALGLANTSLPPDVTMPTPFIHGYEVDPPNPPNDGTDLFAPGWAWAAGAIVSTPNDVDRFIRGYTTGATTNEETAARQFKFVKGESDPPGPGTNEAGLAIFRYKTRCGTVYGHTGNITGGYTQFAAATRDGLRSATVSINSVITPKADARRFPALRKIFEHAVCAALAGT